MTLRLAIPNKGRLSDDAVAVLRRAGIRLESSSERQLQATALDGRLQILFVRASDIPGFIANGAVDCGITGSDVVAESGHALDRLVDLGFGACRLVMAVPNEHAATSSADLPDGTRVATSFPHLAKSHFEQLGKKVRVVEVSGACEVTPAVGVADAILDLTSSGSTLLQNHLREIDTVLTSTCGLFARPPTGREEPDPERERLRFALESVVQARGKRYLLADLPRTQLDQVRSFLPGLAGPTVVDLAGRDDLVAIQVVVDEADVYDAVHQLKDLGGQGILIVPIDRLVP